MRMAIFVFLKGVVVEASNIAITINLIIVVASFGKNNNNNRAARNRGADSYQCL
jgi:hypothetical protein